MTDEQLRQHALLIIDTAGQILTGLNDEAAAKTEWKKQFRIFSERGKHIDNRIEKTESSRADERASNFDLITNSLEFSKKELQTMPKNLKKEFIHITERKSGNGICYEIRYRRNGYNICASSIDFKEAKRKFFEKAKNAINQDSLKSKTLNFNEIADEWFSVKEKTWHPRTTLNYKSYYKRYILEEIGEYEIAKIRTVDIDKIMTTLNGKGRVYEDVRSILNQIFIYANTNGLLTHNPVKLIEFKKFERKHGKALTIEEERKLIEELRKKEYKKFRQPILALLFFGLRPIELKSIEIEKNFIKTINAKRKKGKIEFKRIPISIQAKTFLNFNESLKTKYTMETVYKYFQKILPNHTLYDLRHTFATRCREKVSKEVTGMWLGHKPKELVDNTYNQFSDEYQIHEMKKVNYLNNLFPKLFPKNE